MIRKPWFWYQESSILTSSTWVKITRTEQQGKHIASNVLVEERERGWGAARSKPKARLRLYRNERVEARLDGSPPHPWASGSHEEHSSSSTNGGRGRSGRRASPRLCRYGRAEALPSACFLSHEEVGSSRASSATPFADFCLALLLLQRKKRFDCESTEI